VTLVVQHSRFLHYNAGAFVSAGKACLVDPGILREEVEALVASTGGVELAAIVLTHADWDHVLGPQYLPAVPVVAHEAYAEDLDADATRLLLAQLEAHAGVTRTETFDPPLPTTTLADRFDLRVGDLELRLEHAPGHARSMLTIYVQRSGVLWAADVLSDVELPSVIDDLQNYEITLERLAGLEIATLVPGHGNRTDDAREIQRRLDEDRDYLARLRRDVSAAVAAGSTLTETVATCATAPYHRSEEDDVTHRLNVEKVYADLGGEADPADVGFARAWKDATDQEP
jgi:glyoxylase-like metal-dependent hydrolase (beta-lactamase superfamily II)